MTNQERATGAFRLLGQVTEGVAIVDDGVAAGEQVVTAGQYRLQPGARVEVNSPAAKG